MHTVELLEQALAIAEGLGYKIRQEWLGGGGGGCCEIAGRKWLFLDLALNVDEQLDQVIEGLRDDSGIFAAPLSAELRRMLGVRKSA